MPIMNGTSLRIYNTTNVIANAQECTISLSMDTREIITKDSGSGGWREVLEGTRSVSLSTSGLYEDNPTYGVDDLMTLYTGRTAATLKFSTEQSGENFWSGSFFLTSLEISAPAEDSVTFSASFELNGALTYSQVSP